MVTDMWADTDFTDILMVNDEIQDYISNYGADVPIDLIHLLSDLDWTVRNLVKRK